ncbi:hypothetical protein ACVWXU_008600 [Streptomyces sp. TE33382]
MTTLSDVFGAAVLAAGALVYAARRSMLARKP